MKMGKIYTRIQNTQSNIAKTGATFKYKHSYNIRPRPGIATPFMAIAASFRVAPITAKGDVIHKTGST